MDVNQALQKSFLSRVPSLLDARLDSQILCPFAVFLKTLLGVF